ncbi:MAG TPA: aminopeptidase P N-terminal domain-containing protein, partial [Pyrinomonadaceae bacterium]
MKKNIIALISLFAFSVTAMPFSLQAETLDKSVSPPAIRVTPPAPKFTDAERQSELARRRAEVAKKMAANSLLVLRSAEPRNYAGDVDFYYRQENNLYYLTNLKQTNATLVIAKTGDSVQEYLFLPKRNPQFETWNGKMYSREDATRISGLKTIFDSSETAAFMQALKEKKAFAPKEGASISTGVETLYLQLPQSEGDGIGMAEFRRENEFVKGLTGYKIENARPIFGELRHVKSPYEIKLLQHAIDITTEAQMRSMAMVGKAKYEYEVHAEVDYTFRRRNADYWGYPSIVGCGP